MEIKDLDYNIQYDEATKTVKFTGSIRLQNLPAYEPIKLFLKDAAKQCQGSVLIIDFRDLQFVNSSGITTFSMFIIDSRKSASYQIKILGSLNVSWQSKSLSNFKKLWDQVVLDIS
ncbi:hypothetical protein LEP1GSC202_0674 [Leptospira yanagawae serovar Saopaulo str. Sao Paulo = ATCC 700523]|uniref:STAS domain-containing protein n=1 Tax=Leptospira yanagawae serovar Saopaulo str. Sao Paulo = ATCC 700523 TaxID=1249483 RepID=A0A5E8HI20_9LEPT|nr:hypothetical protein [Leptospira yanagawae]EOQ90140.1 hypothetical protein LEP1GSC202_0674 [Leptospira yanagawae serovar Saopaulo str. Sao Paulo = ATCC 700523]